MPKNKRSSSSSGSVGRNIAERFAEQCESREIIHAAAGETRANNSESLSAFRLSIPSKDDCVLCFIYSSLFLSAVKEDQFGGQNDFLDATHETNDQKGAS